MGHHSAPAGSGQPLLSQLSYSPEDVEYQHLTPSPSTDRAVDWASRASALTPCLTHLSGRFAAPRNPWCVQVPLGGGTAL